MNIMITEAAIGVVLVAGAIGLAAPATADTPSGTYTGTVIGGGWLKEGVTKTFVFTPCGPDCTHYQLSGGEAAADLHLQGDTWTGTQTPREGTTYTTTLDKNSLVLTQNLLIHTAVFQLAKNG